jgi:hypothetical protein
LNDDYWALFILKGTVLNRAPSEWNLLENVILCLGLKDLYLKFPAIQWYTWFFVTAEFLSLWAILASFQLGSSRFFKTSFFIISSVALEIHFFDCLQWTMVAAVAAAAALLLLAGVWRRGDWRFLPLGLAMAFVLLLISVLIRYKALLLMAAVFFPAMIYLSWKIKMTGARWTILLFLTFAAALSVAAVIYDRDYYSRDPDWKKAREAHVQQDNLIDLRNPVYNKTTKPLFDSIGWTANDFNLFISHYWMDEDVYSAEKLKKICDYFPQLALNKDTQDSFGAMFLNLRTPLAILFFLAMFPFLLEDFWQLVFSGGWTVLIVIFCWFDLKIPERIYLPCFFLQINTIISFADFKSHGSAEKSNQVSPIFRLGIFYLGLIFLFSVYLIHLEYNRNREWTLNAADLKTSVEKLNPQDDQLYITWGSAFPYEKIDAFNMDFLKHFHVVSLAWFERTPTTQAMLDWFGYKNLFKEMVDSPDVFLICSPYQYSLYYAYMLEKYKLKTYGLAVFKSKLFNVYAIHRVRKNPG